MPEKAHFIGPYDFGLETGERPWLLTDDAFSLLRNVYTWRNRVKKRIGSELCPGNSVKQLGSRLRIDIPGGAAVGITDGGGNATAIVPGAVGAIGQMFSIGTVIYTVTTIGVAQPMLRTDGTTTATFDTTNGTYVFAGAPATTQVYWYPALPVMGLMNYEDAAINAEPTFGFDTIYSYKKNTNGWVCLDPTVQWSGTDSQFFWGTIYRGTLNDNNWLFVVNNNQADQIKFWNGAAWVTFAPATLPAPAVNYTLHSARLIVSFKDRLIALNTIEQVGAALPALNFSNRARWCQTVIQLQQMHGMISQVEVVI